MSYFLVAQKEMHVYYFVNQLPKLTTDEQSFSRIFVQWSKQIYCGENV